MNQPFGFHPPRSLHQFVDDASPPAPSTIEPSFKRAMMYIFVGTRGGYNRARIVELLKEEPQNPHKIAERLHLDYKTVQHHLRLLEANEVVVTSSPRGYAAVYFLTPYAERHLAALREMWAKFGQS